MKLLLFVFALLIQWKAIKSTESEISDLDTKGSPGCYRIVDYNLNDTYNCCERDYVNPCTLTDCPSDRNKCILIIPACTSLLGIGCKYEPQSKCQQNCEQETEMCNSKGCLEVYETNGCKNCSCNNDFEDPCLTKKCPEDSYCRIERAYCITAPCPLQAQCYKKCPEKEIKCPTGCAKYFDSDGCEQCYCCNGCASLNCKQNEECVLQPVNCIQAPCNPTPHCTKKQSN